MRLTNPLWYLAAVLVAIAGSMVGTAIAASAWDGVRDAVVEPATEPINAAGHSLAIFTDQLQPERDIACRSRPADQPEAEGTALSKASIDIVVDRNGSQWHLIALAAEGRDGVIVSCLPADGAADSAAYGYAVFDGSDKIDRGTQVGALSLAAGLVLAGFVFWCRWQAGRTTEED
ncbi:MAG: hypothetical protein QM597_08730 [Aeromicrobium sp.]|uniref:hypothetical protein n=1 Tax=Aeromicrobium sp. TaxID=1871063 RepID=UPI0039E3A0A1